MVRLTWRQQTCLMKTEKGGDSCCDTKKGGCLLGEGDCDKDSQCAGDLVCGFDNCGDNSGFDGFEQHDHWSTVRLDCFDRTDDCCMRIPSPSPLRCLQACPGCRCPDKVNKVQYGRPSQYFSTMSASRSRCLYLLNITMLFRKLSFLRWSNCLQVVVRANFLWKTLNPR